MDTKTINECIALCFEDKIKFPEVIKKLAAIGIERYCADFISLEVTYYNDKDEVYRIALPLPYREKVADNFSESSLHEAVQTIQKGQIDYPEFLRRIMKAGTICYTVFLKGKHVRYMGRKGELYLQKFPQ